MNRHQQRRTFQDAIIFTEKSKTWTTVKLIFIAISALLSSNIVAPLLQPKIEISAWMSPFLNNISNQTLNSIIKQELPLYASSDVKQSNQESPSNFLSMVFFAFTSINVEHPETMISESISAMAVSKFEPLTKDPGDINPGPEISPSPTIQEPSEGAVSSTESLPLQEKPMVYIYQSHNRESFLGKLRNELTLETAYDKEKNITLVGERLAKSLQNSNISVLQTKTDYWTMGPFEKSYDFSRQTLKKILNNNESIKMVFDIHRDSLTRDKTTAVINGKNAASIFFIIGGSNKNWQKNSEFTKKLDSKTKQMYPGLSKGVTKKTSTAYDTRYNQDLHPNSVIIEIGGPENTLDEANYTADLLANVISQLIKENETGSNS